MIRQDYLMRMIDQLVKALAKILSNKEIGNYSAALNNIDDALTTIVGIDHNIITQLSAKDIIALLEISKDDSTVSTKCIVIAKLLKEKADLLKQNCNDKSTFVNNYQKAITLYLHGIRNIKNVVTDLHNYHLDVKEIAKNIIDEIPDETRFSLFKYYEQIGEFDNAEDELFKLKNINFPKIKEEGILFFRNLEKLSDIELLKGNFSKEEIVQGLDDFTKTHASDVNSKEK